MLRQTLSLLLTIGLAGPGIGNAQAPGDPAADTGVSRGLVETTASPASGAAPATTATVGEDLAPPARSSDAIPDGPIRLEVDLSERVLRVYSQDEVVRSYNVAVGKSVHPTPKGSFRVQRIIWNPTWVPPNAGWAKGKTRKGPGDPKNPMGRVKIFFKAPDYYIHGTDDEQSIGKAASHGCIRMRNEDVIALARLTMERGGEVRSPNWFQRVLNRVKSTEEVRLSSPVPLSIKA